MPSFHRRFCSLADAVRDMSYNSKTDPLPHIMTPNHKVHPCSCAGFGLMMEECGSGMTQEQVPCFDVDCCKYAPPADCDLSTMSEIICRVTKPTLASLVRIWNYDTQDANLYHLRREDGCIKRPYKTVEQYKYERPFPERVTIEDIPFYDCFKVPGETESQAALNPNDHPVVEWDPNVMARLTAPTFGNMTSRWSFDNQDAALYHLKLTDPKVTLPYKTKRPSYPTNPPSGLSGRVTMKDVPFFDKDKKLGVVTEPCGKPFIKNARPWSDDVMDRLTRPTVANTTTRWNFDGQDGTLLRLKQDDPKVKLPFKTVDKDYPIAPSSKRLKVEDFPFFDKDKKLGVVKSATERKFIKNAKPWKADVMKRLAKPTVNSVVRRYNFDSRDATLLTMKMNDPKIKIPYYTTSKKELPAEKRSKFKITVEDIPFFDKTKVMGAKKGSRVSVSPGKKKNLARVPWSKSVLNRLGRPTVSCITRRYNYDTQDGTLYILRRNDPEVKLKYKTLKGSHPNPGVGTTKVTVEDLPFFDESKELGYKPDTEMIKATPKKVYTPWDDGVMNRLTRPTVATVSRMPNYDCQDGTLYHLRQDDPNVKLDYKTVNKEDVVHSARMKAEDLPFFDKTKWPANKQIEVEG